MATLDHLLESRPELTLDELVETANDLLGRYLPTNLEDARIKEEVNPRLVRHYTTEEMLDPPIPKGRERRYTVDHLLQLLALRRLLAEGLSASQVGRSLRESTRAELRRIIEGGRAAVAAPNAPSDSSTPSAAGALAAIERIRRRASGSGKSGAPPSASSSQADPAGLTLHRFEHRPPDAIDASAYSSTPSHPKSEPQSDRNIAPTGIGWERFHLMDGVELSVRSDVVTPSSPEAQERLLDDITRLLIQIGQRRIK